MEENIVKEKEKHRNYNRKNPRQSLSRELIKKQIYERTARVTI
jgi:hypothetical protein